MNYRCREFKREVERHLTGKQTEAWELIYFELFKSQLPVIEQALETAAMMLGSDKSRGYMLEMICADFLAGANAGNENSDSLLLSLDRLFGLLPHLKHEPPRLLATVPATTGTVTAAPCEVMKCRSAWVTKR